MFKLTEIWDNIAYIIYNFFAYIRYFFYDRFKYRKILLRNRELKDIHKGERCFIALNGPSISEYDLSKLENEFTICSNYFYLSKYHDIIKPNYYCICDSDSFLPERMNQIHDLFEKGENIKYIFNKKAMDKLNDEEKKNTYFVYGMHMPNYLSIRKNLGSMSSSFTNVSMFCVICAMYMGFTEINILGCDFSPGGGLVHCYGNTKDEESVNEVYKRKDRVNLCTFYWSYYLAHVQSFYVEKYAKKHGVKIFNLNPNSYIRAFDFEDFNHVTSMN